MKNTTKQNKFAAKEIIRQNNIILDNYRKGFKLIEEAIKKVEKEYEKKVF